jgi:hypothetical protein
VDELLKGLPAYFSCRELAQRLNVTQMTVAMWYKRFGLPRPIQLNHHCHRLSREKVRAWLISGGGMNQAARCRGRKRGRPRRATA